MKKILSIGTILFFCAHICAQFTVTNSQGYIKLTEPEYNLDALVLLNGIDASTSIEYTGSENIEWRYMLDGSEYNSTQKDMSPEANTLYTIYINNTAKYHIYTIDYTEFLPQLNALEVIENDEDKCQRITISPDVIVPKITYLDREGKSHSLIREFTLSYNNSAWQDSAWVDIEQDTTILCPITPFAISAPYKSTTFRFYGDQWAKQLGMVIDTIMTDYTAIAVKCYPRGKVVEREYLNEKDRSNDPNIEGSAPLVVEFESRANPLDIVYYEWFVSNVESPNAYQRYNDTDLRYTFDKTGEYKVKLIATSNTCEYIDSLNVRVLESYLSLIHI